MKRFTQEEDQFIKDHYLALPAFTIEKLLGRAKGTVRQRIPLLGLIIPPSIKIQFVNGSYFKKGLAPFNKGKSISEYVKADKIEKIKSTQFKKGHAPKNTLYDNAVVKRRDKTGITYLYIRVSLAIWVPLQRYIWEQKNGPIPEGHNIVFKDRNTFNCNLDNLELVSNADLMLRNSAHRFGTEIFKIIQLRGALNRQINKRLKELSNEK
jgi:hypothetical protein